MIIMGGTYGVNVSCDNCGFVGVIQVARGWKVKNARCPVCSCDALELSKLELTDKGRLNERKLGFYETIPPETLAEDVKEDIEPCA